jgi:hypothetical protein
VTSKCKYNKLLKWEVITDYDFAIIARYAVLY